METLKFELCHFENTKWAESLTFYADEIKFFVRLLKDVLQRNTDEEITAKAQYFLTLFKHNESEIENLAIAILEQEKSFAEYAQGKQFLFDQQVQIIHERRRSAFQTLEKDFVLHKHQLYQFLSNVL
jgi:hypothetical protein